jgi:hypothetical protein
MAVNRRDELTPPQSVISIVYRADRHSDPAPNDSLRPLSGGYRSFIAPILKGAQGHFDLFAMPAANDRYLRI